MKKKILIASLLKPVDDVRIYWKLSKSIAKTNKYAVNIIGNDSKNIPDDPLITFSPTPLLPTNYLKRWLRSNLLLFTFCKQRPAILIVTTNELLFAGVICKWITNCKLIYDVQENFFANLRHLRGGWSGWFAAYITRISESFWSQFVDQFWLAEKCYKRDLPFIKNEFILVENKAFSIPESDQPNQPLSLLFSGTISTYGGIRLAVSWYREIKKMRPDAQLKVIGQVHDPNVESFLSNAASADPNIYLEISRMPISHSQILQAIQASHLGLIGYQENEVNKGKLPTKLYEYSRYHLPFLIVANSNWSTLGQKLGGAIPVDPLRINAKKILETLEKSEHLFPKVYPGEATWEHESGGVIESIDSLTK